MRKFVGVFLAFGSFVGTADRGWADDREAALQVIDRAIRAHGGEERLARAQTMSRTAKGIVFFFGKEIPLSSQLTLAFPDRFRDVIEMGVEGQKTLLTRVVNRDKGWEAIGGMAVEMPKESLEDLLEEAYVIWLTTLVPLKDSRFGLEMLPDARVSNQAAAGVKVSCKGHGEVKMYFDKQNGRLLKIERPRAREAGVVAKKEYLFSEPREFQGITLATKQVESMDGKKTTELTVTGCDFPGKIEDKVFAKP